MEKILQPTSFLIYILNHFFKSSGQIVLSPSHRMSLIASYFKEVTFKGCQCQPRVFVTELQGLFSYFFGAENDLSLDC